MRIRTIVAATMLALAAAAVWAGPAMASGGGAVYALSNSPSGNSVLAFDRAADGNLTAAGSVASGGTDTGGGLGSQGAVIVTPNGRWLFAVNAGSNSVSSFAVRRDGLELVDTEASGGDHPTSLTFDGRTLYVLNAGLPNSISGFSVDRGQIEPIAGSTQPLSAEQTNPAQVEFSPDGDVLVVTERLTNLITTYAVGPGGVAGLPTSYPSIGVTPFGFACAKRGQLIVPDAGGASGASSYRVGPGGTVTPIMGLAPTGQRAACWTVVTNNGR